MFKGKNEGGEGNREIVKKEGLSKKKDKRFNKRIVPNLECPCPQAPKELGNERIVHNQIQLCNSINILANNSLFINVSLYQCRKTTYNAKKYNYFPKGNDLFISLVCDS
jgi:hypothetical protein